MGSSIIKTVKRAMAGEYSRELSAKVFAGQANLIRRGFRQGGAAGFGLRRLLLDEFGEPKCELKRLQQKFLTTDRVVLVPGPPAEVAVVREIFGLFVEGGIGPTSIASLLNARGIPNNLDRPWTMAIVWGVLKSEKYVGNNVWGRTSTRLKQTQRHVAPELWVRSDGVFEAVVDPVIFNRAQEIIRTRQVKIIGEEPMLEALRKLLRKHGRLTVALIKAAKGIPCADSYVSGPSCELT